VRRWQSADRHIKLKTIMQDRPDLIESELSGLAFDSLQQVFKAEHIEVMFRQPIPPPVINEDVHIFVDPAAGGPYSDYAVLSVTRQKGLITVRIADGCAEGRALCTEYGKSPLDPILEQHGFFSFVFNFRLGAIKYTEEIS